mmetsp:Transcript_31984/g.49966  ORF Transcript_31984/g.49966 Transcript_31984/m.49966 type:complete len:434 (+) Transcript_31984:60-1361(+)
MRASLSFSLWAVVLVLGLALPGLRAEEDGGSTDDPIGDAGVGMAGYVAPSVVSEHAKIDLDIKDIEAAGTDWAAIKQIYMEGKNSAKSSGLRNLQSMSTSFSSGSDEYWAKIAHDYWGAWDFADQHLMAVLDGTDSALYGNYATGVYASTDAARKQMVKKLIKFTLLLQYAIHEAEAALVKFNDEKQDGDYRYGVDGSVHAWDEWWAFYVGSLEDGSVEPGEEGEGVGYGPYILAEKRARSFGTDNKIVSNGGKSRVNWDLIFAAYAGQRYLQMPAEGEAIMEIQKCLRGQHKVPLIQACLEYGYKSSSSDITPDADLAKIKAEAWAFCAAILPSIHEASATDAETIKTELHINTERRPDWSKVMGAFGAETLNKMGVSCDAVNELSDEDYPDNGHKKCKDSKMSNDMADTDVCGDIKMPSSASIAKVQTPAS